MAWGRYLRDAGPASTSGSGRALPASGLDDPPADGVADETGGPVDVELGHQPAPVRLGGLDGHSQERGSFLRRLALRNELQDLALPGTQRVRGEAAPGAVR